MTTLTSNNYFLFALENIARKSKRKLSSIALIRKIKIICFDLFKSLKFLISIEEKNNFKKVFDNCQNLDDYYQFSVKILGTMQIKSEILGFLDFVRSKQPQYICEIGVADGGTNFLLSQAIKSTRILIGIDLYVKNRNILHYFSQHGKHLNYISGSSNSKKTIQKVGEILTDNKLDLLFIDGDHSYEGVKKDFLNYRHLVRENGLIVFHDIMPDYQTRYGTKTGRDTGGVPIFYSKLKSHYTHYEFVENPEQDGYGIGVICYSSQIKLPNEL